MKTKTKRIPHKRDRNMESAYTAGYAARFVGKPSTQCPNLTRLFDERYATALMNEWLRAWHIADKQLRQTEMKGAD